MVKFYLVSDVDVEKSDHGQIHPSFNPKAEKRRKNYTTLNKAKKRLKKHTNNSLPFNNEGTQNQCFFFLFCKHSIYTVKMLHKNCNEVKKYT